MPDAVARRGRHGSRCLYGGLAAACVSLPADETEDVRTLGLPASGGVAQLGERRLCKPEVIGSNPFTSTSWQLHQRHVEARRACSSVG
jgi:hypothetical protein